MTTNTEQLLREALHKIKHEAVSLADAQVIALEALTQTAQAGEAVPWVRHDLDSMVKAFERVIEAHASRACPFHNPIDADASLALRYLKGYVPYMKWLATTPPASQEQAQQPSEHASFMRQFDDARANIAAISAAMEQQPSGGEVVAWRDLKNGEVIQPGDRLLSGGKNWVTLQANERPVGAEFDEVTNYPIQRSLATKPEHFAVPEGYALIAVEALRAWGKLDEVKAACVYPTTR